VKGLKDLTLSKFVIGQKSFSNMLAFFNQKRMLSIIVVQNTHNFG